MAKVGAVRAAVKFSTLDVKVGENTIRVVAVEE